MDDLGKRIKERRKELKISSAEKLAEITKLSKGSIQSYESGRDTPRADSLLILCEHLDCDPGYLLGTQDEPRLTIELAAKAAGVDYEQIQKLSSLSSQSKEVLNSLLKYGELDNFFRALYHWSEQAILGRKIDSIDNIDRHLYHRIMQNFENELFKSGNVDSLLDVILSSRIRGDFNDSVINVFKEIVHEKSKRHNRKP